MPARKETASACSWSNDSWPSTRVRRFDRKSNSPMLACKKITMQIKDRQSLRGRTQGRDWRGRTHARAQSRTQTHLKVALEVGKGRNEDEQFVDAPKDGPIREVFEKLSAEDESLQTGSPRRRECQRRRRVLEGATKRPTINVKRSVGAV